MNLWPKKRKVKSKNILLLLVLLLCKTAIGQNKEDGILKTILSTYYKSEKPVVKGRAQFLFLFCEKANNNEELFETINQLRLPSQEANMLKNRIKDKSAQNWSNELDAIFADGNQQLKTKINACLSLEEYQAKQQKSTFNNQRLMIISKPVFYTDGKTALVKVVFYRSIEHNYGSILLMKRNAEGNWEIKESLNPWET